MNASKSLETLDLAGQNEIEILKALHVLGYRYIVKDYDCCLWAFKKRPRYSAIRGEWGPAFGDLCPFLMEFRPQETSIGFVKPTDKEPFDIKVFFEGAGYEG